MSEVLTNVAGINEVVLAVIAPQGSSTKLPCERSSTPSNMIATSHWHIGGRSLFLANGPICPPSIPKTGDGAQMVCGKVV